MALGHVGNAPVTDVTESPVCQTYYPTARDSCLTYYPWSFATIRQQLQQLDDSTLVTEEFAHQYLLPTNPAILRVLDTDTKRMPFKREVYIDIQTPETQQPVLLTDADAVVLKYVGRISEGIFPPLFTACLALWLATDISQRLSRKATLRQELFAELQAKLGRLRDMDAHQSWPESQVFDTRYLDTRNEQGQVAPFTGRPL